MQEERIYRHIEKILAVFTVAILLFSWSFTLYKIHAEEKIEIAHAFEQNANLAQVLQEHTYRIFLNIDQVLINLQKQYLQYGPDFDMKQYMQDNLISPEVVNALSITDADGNIILSSHPFEMVNIQDRSYFTMQKNLVTPQPYLSQAAISRLTNKWSVMLSRRFVTPEGEFNGVAVVSLNPFYFSNLYQQVSLGKKGSVTLVGLDGFVRARYFQGNKDLGQDISANPMFEKMKVLQMGNFEAQSIIDGTDRLFSYQVLRDYPLAILVASSKAEVLQEFSQHKTLYLWINFIFTVLVIIATLLFMYSIRRHKQISQSYFMAKESAEIANQVKNEFLANMSHEISTPIHSVVSMAQRLNETPLTAEQKEMTQIIFHSAMSVTEVINDILDLSKIEAGKMQLDFRGFELSDLVNQALKPFSSIVKEKGLELSSYIDQAIPPKLFGDEIKLRQILYHLVSNAIQFTSEGKIEISLYLKEQTEFEAWVFFRVRDTGIGLSAEDYERIFQPFNQGELSMTCYVEGKGLGLAVSRRLSELMGGQLGASQDVSPGSEFWFFVPLQRQWTDMSEVREHSATENFVDI